MHGDTSILKKDLFGEIRLCTGPAGNSVVRDAAPAAPWLRWLARQLLANEARALAAADGIEGIPGLLSIERNRLTRCHIAGLPMQVARPAGAGYFREALRLLRRLHRAGIVHNDLAKEPNLLVRIDGRPAFIDFQLAGYSRRRGRLFRMLAREDLRHLLKHKRTYCAASLSLRQQRILATPSVPSRIWKVTGKPLYLFVTRRLLGWADREGAGDRFP